jgi:hypothetical protein
VSFGKMHTPRAYHKLREANFFLDHLRSEQRDPKQLTSASFVYYLSAFLSAGRSTLWIVELEAKTWLKADATWKKQAKAAYIRWHEAWERGLTEAERADWGMLRDQRDVEVHGLGIETTVQTKPVALKPTGYGGLFSSGSGGDPPAFYVTAEWERWKTEHGFSGWSGAWQGVSVHHFDVGGERQEVIVVCERILGLLDRFLRDLHASPFAQQPSDAPPAGRPGECGKIGVNASQSVGSPDPAANLAGEPEKVAGHQPDAAPRGARRDAMIDAFKTNGASPPGFVRLQQRARLVREHARIERGVRSRRDVWLGLAAILSPWLAALIVTAIWWPR